MLIKRMVKRIAVWAAATVTAGLAMVAVAPPAAHAEPMCASDMSANAFVGGYKLTMMTSGGQFIYNSNLVLGSNRVATEFGTGIDPYTGLAEPLTTRGQWASQYLSGNACTVAFHAYYIANGAIVNCYGGSTPYTNGVRVTQFDGACRLRTATTTITRTFIANRI